MIRRVSQSNNIIADSPYGCKTVFVDRESIESRTQIDLPPRPVESISGINPNIEQAAFVEVVSINSQVLAEVVPRYKRPDSCPRNIKNEPGEVNPDSEAGSYFENTREEKVEWRGTEQNISDKSTKNIIAEEDVRGSKNDLL
jgi:hypothetical protein